MDFQCKECGATPQGKHEDHYELCNCGMIAVSGGEYPRVDALDPEAYKHYLEEIIMGRTKDFIVKVSEEMGHHGEINDDVLDEAQNKMEDLLDNTHDQLKDPEPTSEPTMMVKYGNNELEILFGEVRVFFSYTTPVAVYDPNAKMIYIVDAKHSKTTSKHINKWVSLVEEEEEDCSRATFKKVSLSLDVTISY